MVGKGGGKDVALAAKSQESRRPAGTTERHWPIVASRSVCWNSRILERFFKSRRSSISSSPMPTIKDQSSTEYSDILAGRGGSRGRRRKKRERVREEGGGEL